MIFFDLKIIYFIINPWLREDYILNNLQFDIQEQTLYISLKGNLLRLDNILNLYQLFDNSTICKVSINGQHLENWDSSLLLVLFKLKQITENKNISFETANLPEGLTKMLEIALAVPEHKSDKTKQKKPSILENIGNWGINIYETFFKGFNFAITCFSALLNFIKGKSSARKTDFLFAFEDCAPNAIGIVALISFMVGLILAFVGAIQLKTFGAQVYVASLVTIAMIRIMGAIMVGIIMSGRTGASFAATLGTMQVNEEVDALKTMGINWAEFLVAPRMAALVVSIPFLTMWADFFGILGGAFVGITALDIPAGEYWKYTWEAWDMKSFWIGIFHGLVFGFIISLCGCYYGINSSRNADGVGSATTKAVVSSIVWLIVATGFITFIFERLGI